MMPLMTHNLHLKSCVIFAREQSHRLRISNRIGPDRLVKSSLDGLVMTNQAINQKPTIINTQRSFTNVWIYAYVRVSMTLEALTELKT